MIHRGPTIDWLPEFINANRKVHVRVALGTLVHHGYMVQAQGTDEFEITKLNTSTCCDGNMVLHLASLLERLAKDSAAGLDSASPAIIDLIEMIRQRV